MLIVTACSMLASYEVSERGASFNDALNDYASRQILLNVIRAVYSYPMEFSAVSSLNTSGQLDQGQVSIPFRYGPGSHSGQFITPSLTVQEGISTTWTPLETQAFYQSFLQPGDGAGIRLLFAE